ncbi:MAG: hypothetical protein PHT80_05760 [Lentisphaeria bacterium]|nr:hypothetical protein [Lentisphaeria bacterium]
MDRRWRQVEQLWRLCLSQAAAGASRDLAQKHPKNQALQRTARALGNNATPKALGRHAGEVQEQSEL